MKKRFFRNISFFTLLFSLAFAGRTLAAWTPAPAPTSTYLTFTVNTVIDNIDEYPEKAGTTFKYDVNAFTEYQQTYSGNVYVPKVTATETFSWKHGGSYSVLKSKFKSDKRPVIYFMPSAGTNVTDDKISLSYIEYNSGSNVAAYTYDPNSFLRRASGTLSVSFFNYVAVTGTKPSVTLHFRYNGAVKSTQTVFDPQLSYSKKIDYLGDGGENPDTGRRGVNDYRLYLDAVTDYEVAPEYKRKNIIFVLDCSGSMAYNMDGTQTSNVRKENQRITKLINQANSMITALSADPDNRYSVIRFSGDSNEECTILKNKTDAQSAKTAISGLKAEGGTNYYQGLYLVEDCLDRSDACENIVIFITDGQPTAVPKDIVGGLSSGYDQEYSVALPYAVYQAMSLPGDQIKAFYSILINTNKGYGSTLQTVSQAVTCGGDKASVMVSSETELKNVLDAIAIKLVKKASGLEIKDTLSENVSFLGNYLLIEDSSEGTRVMREGTEYVFTASGHEVEADILEVKPRTRYTLSFDIGASALAVRKASLGTAETDTGDQGTDYEETGNLTSSGKRGLYSNDRATVSMSWTDGGAEFTYGKPVIQVTAPEGCEASLETVKKLYNENTGAYMETPEGAFTFELLSFEDGVTQIYGTAVNGADGTVKFTGIPVPDIRDHEFYIREIPGEDPHITYDTHTAKVTVQMDYDPESGTLIADSVLHDDGAAAEFTNLYHFAPAFVEISAKKILEGYLLRNDKFQFVLKKNTGEFMEKVTNKADGSVDFQRLCFTVPGTYTFEIQENPSYSLDKHVTYDMSKKPVTVSVYDTGNGDLAATVEYPEGNTFTNLFTMTPVNGQIRAHVTLYGMELTSNMFRFGLYDESGALLETQGNNTEGDVVFSEIRYEAPGEFRYTIREEAPEDGEGIRHMTYDTESEISVTVSITDDGTGDLVANPVYSGDERFINSYSVRTTMK